MNHLPNLLTGLRLILSAGVFAALALAALAPQAHGALTLFALLIFVVAAVTDFFDGWLARAMGTESLLGAILDPIADKVLVCAAVLGVLVLRPDPGFAAAGALILFREFSVSALRETTAARGLRLAVTGLAKWKTTLQLVALALWLFRLTDYRAAVPAVEPVAQVLLWLAVAATVITGLDYAAKAWRGLSAEKP